MSGRPIEIPEQLFDLMLIDEAGTIVPSRMVDLYIAKRAVIFGDVKQLLPVYPYDGEFERKIVGPYFDERQRARILEDFGVGDSSCNGSAMRIANKSVAIHIPVSNSALDGDIWLKEHFRCRTDIVEIANEIAYEGEILPRYDNHPSKFKHLRYVEHFGDFVDNSNPEEAMMIVRYIMDKRNDFIGKNSVDDDEENGEYYKKYPDIKTYLKKIGIITPFRAQEYLIKMALKKEGLDQIITAGTVHKFQGSERDIIIFSSVYNRNTAKSKKMMFFNRGGPNMLNVAVTRAKELFIVFGNAETLMGEGTYSDKLMKHIMNPDKSDKESYS